MKLKDYKYLLDEMSSSSSEEEIVLIDGNEEACSRRSPYSELSIVINDESDREYGDCFNTEGTGLSVSMEQARQSPDGGPDCEDEDADGSYIDTTGQSVYDEQINSPSPEQVDSPTPQREKASRIPRPPPAQRAVVPKDSRKVRISQIPRHAFSQTNVAPESKIKIFQEKLPSHNKVAGSIGHIDETTRNAQMYTQKPSAVLPTLQNTQHDQVSSYKPDHDFVRYEDTYTFKQISVKGIVKPNLIRKDLMRLRDPAARPRIAPRQTAVDMTQDVEIRCSEPELVSRRQHQQQQPQHPSYGTSHHDFVQCDESLAIKRTTIKGIVKPNLIRKDLMRLRDPAARPRGSPKSTVEAAEVVSKGFGIRRSDQELVLPMIPQPPSAKSNTYQQSPHQHSQIPKLPTIQHRGIPKPRAQPQPPTMPRSCETASHRRYVVKDTGNWPFLRWQ